MKTDDEKKIDLDFKVEKQTSEKGDRYLLDIYSCVEVEKPGLAPPGCFRSLVLNYFSSHFKGLAKEVEDRLR